MSSKWYELQTRCTRPLLTVCVQITREDDYQDLRDPRPTLIKPPKGAHAPRFLIRALTSPLGSNALQQGVDTAKGQETCDVGGKRTLGNGQQMIWQVPNIPPNAFLGIEQQTFDGSRGKRGTGDRHRRSREQLLRTEPTQDHFLDEGERDGSWVDSCDMKLLTTNYDDRNIGRVQGSTKASKTRSWSWS